MWMLIFPVNFVRTSGQFLNFWLIVWVRNKYYKVVDIDNFNQ